jgi:preprotein translocase subunit YajC
MKKLVSKCLMALMLGATFSAAAQNQNQSQSQSQGQGPSSMQAEPVVTEAATVKATVQKVSTWRKQVTLKDADGNIIQMKFGDNAPDLSQFHKGDEVVANYFRSAAVMLAKPGQTPTGYMQEHYVVSPQDKSQPGGTVVNTIQTTATIEKIDPQKRQVVLKVPSGDTVKLTVDQRVQNLDQIKPGDEIVVRYTEAAGLSLAKRASG